MDDPLLRPSSPSVPSPSPRFAQHLVNGFRVVWPFVLGIKIPQSINKLAVTTWESGKRLLEISRIHVDSELIDASTNLYHQITFLYCQNPTRPKISHGLWKTEAIRKATIANQVRTIPHTSVRYLRQDLPPSLQERLMIHLAQEALSCLPRTDHIPEWALRRDCAQTYHHGNCD